VASHLTDLRRLISIIIISSSSSNNNNSSANTTAPALPRNQLRATRGAALGSRSSVIARADNDKQGKNIFEEVLDVMEGGPKLRKWYGTDSSVNDVKENEVFDGTEGGGDGDGPGGMTEEEDLKEWDQQKRRAVMVTDADTPLGEGIVMQLILAKQPVTALGLTPETALARFGPYVTAVIAPVDDGAAMSAALRRGVRAVICAGRMGRLPAALAADGRVEHVILVSAAGASKPASGGNFFTDVFGDKEEAMRKDPRREGALKEACSGKSIPLTIVRPGSIKVAPGGVKPVVFTQGDNAGAGSTVSLEDVAEVCARALKAPPGKLGQGGGVVEFEVVNGSAAGGPRDWEGLFGALANSK